MWICPELPGVSKGNLEIATRFQVENQLMGLNIISDCKQKFLLKDIFFYF
jgi:hypothetical protein